VALPKRLWAVGYCAARLASYRRESGSSSGEDLRALGRATGRQLCRCADSLSLLGLGALALWVGRSILPKFLDLRDEVTFVVQRILVDAVPRASRSVRSCAHRSFVLCGIAGFAAQPGLSHDMAGVGQWQVEQMNIGIRYSVKVWKSHDGSVASARNPTAPSWEHCHQPAILRLRLSARPHSGHLPVATIARATDSLETASNAHTIPMCVLSTQ